MSILLDKLQGKETARPPVWFMRQAGRVLPNYMALRQKYSFKEMMSDPLLCSKITLLPIEDLGGDAAILFSDLLVLPEAMGMNLEFTDKGPRFDNALNDRALGSISLTKTHYISVKPKRHYCRLSPSSSPTGSSRCWIAKCSGTCPTRGRTSSSTPISRTSSS